MLVSERRIEEKWKQSCRKDVDYDIEVWGSIVWLKDQFHAMAEHDLRLFGVAESWHRVKGWEA